MFGCDQDNSNPKEMFIETHFEFSIQDSESKDLLDPNVINHFSHQMIKVFSFEEGEKKLIDDNTNPNFISNERGFYTILLNTTSEITLLQLSETITDTIKTEWVKGSNYYYNTKMWYNGELKWEKDKTELPILISK